MNYLVTGGSGFIGSHLVQSLLKNGHSVINIDNFDDFYDYKIKIKYTIESIELPFDFDFTNKETDLQILMKFSASDRYRLFAEDIRNQQVLRRIFENYQIDMVIHLAALAGVRPSLERPLEYQDVNIRGSVVLWDLCKEYGIKKFVCASSSSVYGNNEKVPFAETDNVGQPISLYAATKRSTELLGYTYHHLYHIDMVQLRFFTVYGPRQRPDLAIHKFTNLIHKGKQVPFYGDGSTARDYTYIDDIIDGILKSITYLEQNENVYEIINLGENQVVNLNEMLSTIEQELGQKAGKQLLPMQPGDVSRTNADITKARNLLGYQPKTNFNDGIKKFVEWFLSNCQQ